MIHHSLLSRSTRLPHSNPVAPGAWGHSLHDERGATVVIVTLALAALTGMVVLVVDVGGLLTLRRRMVLTADAAALAAAQSCARDQAAEAPNKADELAVANQVDATRTRFETVTCGGSSNGRVELGYSAPKTLVFAPILGAPKEKPVSARAEAIWGPAQGMTPMPIELSVDENDEIDCAFTDPGTVCSYWHDNNARDDWHNSSHWGWINLERSDTSPNDSCPSAGSSTRRGWINGSLLTELTIEGDYSLVCADTGHSNSSWADVHSQIGKIKYFPVNDPDFMVTKPGEEKYAIVGFIPMRIDDVLRGNDPEAVGTPGESGHCSRTHSFAPGDAFDLDTLGCYSGAAFSTANLRISSGKGKKGTVYQEGTDYSHNPGTNEVFWFTAAAPNAELEFDYTMWGTPGACGVVDPDPNGICLVLSWQGPRVAGSIPGNGNDFGLRAIRLDG